MRFLHPPVEHIMQKQVRQQWAHYAPLRCPRHARLHPSILHLDRGLQPALDIEQHPTAVRVFAECLEQKLMIDTVEEPLDVKINDPVGEPAALSCRPDGVDCRSARSVSVRVRMEPMFQQGLKIPANNFLGDAVSDRRNSQWSRSALCFRNVHPTNRRWKVAPGGQPVPQLVEVYASRSLVGLHFLESLPDLSLRDVERLCLSHAAPSITGWPPAKAGYRCPFGPAPLQDFQPYYGQLRPCALHRSIDPHRGHRFERFPSHQDDRFPRSLQKPVSESRRLRAGCRLGRASGLRLSLSRDDHMT